MNNVYLVIREKDSVLVSNEEQIRWYVFFCKFNKRTHMYL